MRRFSMMAVCGLGLLVGSAGESQAFCCLFGGLFHSSYYPSYGCCYSPPACCPSPCYSNTCGYVSTSYYAPSACCPTSCCPTSCCPTSCGYGCATCPTGCCGSSCAGGNCGVTSVAVPTAAILTPVRPQPMQVMTPTVLQPVSVTPPRVGIQPVVTREMRHSQAELELRQSSVNSQWVPVNVVR